MEKHLSRAERLSGRMALPALRDHDDSGFARKDAYLKGHSFKPGAELVIPGFFMLACGLSAMVRVASRKRFLRSAHSCMRLLNSCRTASLEIWTWPFSALMEEDCSRANS